MFRKLKQRIEEGEQQQQPTSPNNVLVSTPKKNSRPPSVRSYIQQQSAGSISNWKQENKWEKRRRSNASLYSSRESLLSVDSCMTATLSRNSQGESFCSAGTPNESPLILNTFRDVGSKEEIFSELGKKNEQVKKLENKINEMALAFMEQSRQRDRLEEALQNIKNEMQNRTQSTINDSIRVLRDEYEGKLQVKEKQLKEYIHKHEQETNRFSDAKELTILQQEEVGKMKAMLIHSQTEMSRKTAELVEKTKQIENLDKQYMEQRLELEGLQERLDTLSKDRAKFDTEQKQFSMQISTLEKEKSALKYQLSDLITELTGKSSTLGTVQLTADRLHEEVSALRQTHNLYKAKATSDIEDKTSEIKLLKERINDLEQRLQDSQLSENDQIKAIEKERDLLESRLNETRNQMSEIRLQSNDKVSTLGSLVTSLDEKVKEKTEMFEKLQTEQQTCNQNYERKINDLQEKLSFAERSMKTHEGDSIQMTCLQQKVKELEQKVSALKTEKLELEILADKSSFLEAQNKLLDTRFKETVERLETDRSQLEETLRGLQAESRKSSFRQEHTTRRKIDQLETKVEEQSRRIEEYQHRLEELVEEKDAMCSELALKEDECKEAASCLEDALTKTNELKEEISKLEIALQERDQLITIIKEGGEVTTVMEQTSIDSLLREEIDSVRDMFNRREQELIERDEEIEELRRVIHERDEELVTVSRQLHEFQENNKLISPRNKSKNTSTTEKELQKTVVRLTTRIQELEKMNQTTKSYKEVEVENRSLKAEVEESTQKVNRLQQTISDLKKHCQKEMKNNDTNYIQTKNEINKNENAVEMDLYGALKNEREKRDYLEVNFKYLKHVILKYMCSTNDQSRQLVGVIGHLLQFTTRESSIVHDCFDWKLPLEK